MQEKQGPLCLLGFVASQLICVLRVFFGLNMAWLLGQRRMRLVFAGTLPIAIEYSGIFASVLFSGVCAFWQKGTDWFCFTSLVCWPNRRYLRYRHHFSPRAIYAFQLLVPTTASFAGDILGLMGNTVVVGTDLGTTMPTLQVTGALGTAKFAVAWPCAGIESLLIFTAVALLFLKSMPISMRAKVGYLAFGAAITYLINIFRIVSIFMIGMQFGVDSSQVEAFHAYYGPIYAVAWIISYPLLILISQMAWQKYRSHKPSEVKTFQPKPLSLA